MELYILFIGMVLGVVGGLWFYKFLLEDPERREERKLFTSFMEARKKAVSNFKDNYEKLIVKISAEYKAKKELYEKQIKELDEKLRIAEVERDTRIATIQEETLKIVDAESQRKAAGLANVQTYYDQQEQQIREDFEHFQAGIAWEKKELQDKIKQEQAKYDEIVESFKRQEQIKQDKNFYRIVLSESQLEDVRKLKSIAAELHDPSILYKLIYKTYYERPFNEMVGRVVTGRGDTGIYKITNLENGRVYIGQTRQAFKERWRTHVKRGLRAEPTTNNKLYAAMWEEGVENFTFEVLAECKATELNEKEKDYISLYHGDTWGYNSTSGNNN